ncbi:hypothetical protein [Bosea sp. R86505]
MGGEIVVEFGELRFYCLKLLQGFDDQNHLAHVQRQRLDGKAI